VVGLKGFLKKREKRSRKIKNEREGLCCYEYMVYTNAVCGNRPQLGAS
jgi:hypothetical protein